MFKFIARLSRCRFTREKFLIGVLATLLATIALSPEALCQTTPISDSDFLASSWTLDVFSNYGSPSNVTASQVSQNGFPLRYRAVTNTVAQDTVKESIVLGVHIYGDLSISGTYLEPALVPFISIKFSISYECPASVGSCGSLGQGFGFALRQGGKDYIANTNGIVTGSNTSWTTSPPHPGFVASDFFQVQPDGSTNNIHPVFSTTGGSIQCGFYTIDATQNLSYSITAGYDNWSCSPQRVGSFSVTKMVSPDPLGIGSSLVFPVTANCGSPANTYVMSVHGNTSAMPISNVPFGSQCQFSEPSMPTLPRGCTWLPAQFAPQPLIIGGTNSNEIVTNGYQCPTGSFSVTKIVAPDPLGIGASLVFPIIAYCGSHANIYAMNVHGNTSAMPISNVPFGSQCQFSEPSMPTLPPGCAWLPAQFAPQPLIINGTNNNETVTNGYRCQAGSLSVTKTFVDATGSPFLIGPLNFNVGVSCGSGSTNLLLTTGPTNTTSSSVPGVVSNIPINNQCTLTEPYPPITPVEIRACEANGAAGTPYWDTVYTPTSPITIAAGSNSETVTNTLRCKRSPQTGSLSVTKTFVDATGSPIIIGPLNFNVSVNCGSGPTNLPLTTGPTNTTSSSAPGVVSSMPINSQCTLTETPPLITAVEIRACETNGAAGSPYWDTTYTPASPITIAAGSNSETVTNTLHCKVNRQTGSLSVTKTFVNATGSPLSIPPQTFNVSVNCGSGPTNLPLTPTTATNNANPVSNSAPGIVSNIPVNSQCGLAETYPSLSGFEIKACEINGAHGTPYWDTVYAPTSPIAIAAGSNSETVTNTLRCRGREQTGSLTIKKIVVDPLGIAASQTFPITWDCRKPPSVPDGNGVFPASVSNSSFTTPGLSLPSVCQVSEAVPGPFTFGGKICTWQNPPAQSPSGWFVTVNGASQTVTFTNSYTCRSRGGDTGRTTIVVPPQPGIPPDVCPDGQPSVGGVCALHCTAPMVPNKDGTACGCPRGTKLQNGVCVDKKSTLDNILGHVSIGIGPGSGQSHGGSRDTPTPGAGH